MSCKDSESGKYLGKLRQAASLIEEKGGSSQSGNDREEQDMAGAEHSQVSKSKAVTKSRPALA